MNIAEILKSVPKGTKLYSPVCGELSFVTINDNNTFPIICGNECSTYSFTKEGKYVDVPNGECVLFPSKENKDWSKFKVEKSHGFKPFDKVLVRNGVGNKWKCDYFSHMSNDNYYYVCIGNIWKYCIPYNDNTKHLIGTN